MSSLHIVQIGQMESATKKGQDRGHEESVVATAQIENGRTGPEREARLCPVPGLVGVNKKQQCCTYSGGIFKLDPRPTQDQIEIVLSVDSKKHVFSRI